MPIAETIYEKLTDDDEARLCDDIGAAACYEAPSSFATILLSHFLTKLGDALASPKTTLAWVTSVVGAPTFVLGFLVPIRESGSLIPQLFIGGAIRRLPVRKWVWVLGSLVQSAAVLGIGAVVLFLRGAAAGWAILALVTLFSFARGFCSVASKDVLGKAIPKTKRGQLTGWATSAAGLVTLAVGLLLILPATNGNRGDPSPYGYLIIAAGGLWAVAAAVYSRIAEQPGETGGGRSALEAIARLHLLASDRPFRRFVIARALLMCSALSAPFYIALAQSASGSPSYLLGLFVAASGLADLLSAPLWGRFADRSSKHVMIAAGLATAAVGLMTVTVDFFAPHVVATLWFMPLAYLGLSVAHSGVRVGRKTYVVDLAGGNRRTDYVAISNSVIGVLLLVVGSIGILVPTIGNPGVIACLAAMGLAGAALGTALPSVQG